MIVQIANANAVIVARHFNPSIVNPLWLVDNGIMARDDFEAGCVFTDMLANVVSRRFNLLVTPEQLQFVPREDQTEHQRLAQCVVGLLVETLPHTPYSAAGLNFTWHLLPEAVGIGPLCRTLFFDGQRELFRAFDVEDARFGGNFSKNALGCRMKLDVKPVVDQARGETTELLQFAFNFHLDVDKTRAVEIIRGFLGRWNEAQEMSSAIVSAVRRQDS